MSWRHARTDRLWLDEPVESDAEALFAIHSDPASWVHFPSGVLTDPAVGEVMVGASRRRFERDGLAYWSVRDEKDGPVVGRGYATEMGAVAIEAARDVAPERPVMAYLLEHNVGSRRTAEKLGLRLVWRGPDEGNPDPDAIRLVFLDRDPDDQLVAAMSAAAMPESGLLRP